MAKLKPDYIEWVIKLNSTQAQEEYHKLEKANRELQKETNASRKAMTELEKQGKKGSQEWKNLKSSIEQNNRVMGQNRQKMQEIAKQFDQSTMTVNQLRKQLKDLTKEFNNTSKASDPKRYKELQDQIQRTKEALNQATGSAKNLQGGFTGLTKMKGIIVGFFAGIGASIMTNIVGAFKNAFNIVVDFERENSRLAAILGTTKDGISEMTKAARDLGGSTSYSAAEVTQLQIELAKLGFAKDQILDMESAVLKFAKAVDTDLASASAFTGAALRIFGLDANQAEDALASFAIATTKTALDFSKLETALATVGPVAAAAGFSLEDTTALLGQLANAGFDASSAATSTRNIILKMVDPAGDLAKALGGPAKNAEELAEGFKKLKEKGVDLVEALELTDKRSVAAFQTFIDQSDSLVSLRNSISGCTDQFNEMAGTMGDNVAGAMAGLRSASEELMLQLSEGSNSVLKDLINLLTDGVKKLQDFVKWIQNNSKWVKTIVAALVSWKATQIALTAVGKIWLALLKAKALAVSAYQGAVKLATAAQALFTNGVKATNLSLQTLKTTMMSIPWTAIITAITSVVAAVVTWNKANEEGSEILDNMNRLEEEHAKAREECEAAIKSETQKLLELHKVAEDETAAEEDRLRAIDALNAAIPGYNGYINSTTGALVANTKALYDNIKAMEQRMRLAYFREEYEKYLKEQQAAEVQWRKSRKERKEFLSNEAIIKNGEYYPSDPKVLAGYMRGTGAADDWRKRDKATRKAVDDSYNALQSANKNIKEFREIMTDMNVSLSKVLASGSEVPEVSTALPSTGGKGSGGGKSKGKGKGKSKSKTGKGNSGGSNTPKKDLIKEATRAADLKHLEKVALLEEGKEDLSDADAAIKEAQELIRYCGELNDALEELRGKTKATDTDLLNKINEREAKIQKDVARAEQAINAAYDAKAEQAHADRLEALDAFYDEQETIMIKKVQNQEIMQEAADIYLLAQQKKTDEDKLAELQRYYDEVEKAEYLGEEKRRQRLAEIQTNIKATQRDILTDTGFFMEKLREMTSDPESAAGIKAAYESRKIELIQSYEEMKKLVKKDSDEFVALEEAKNRKLLLLDYQYQDQLYALQENVGLSWANEYDRELLHLKEMHAQGVISEKDYQRKRLELGIENAKKYFDFYAGLSGSMFQSIQDAEIAASDAKYDVLIRQAENNGEETAQLELEKENKKLEIQKKYTDVNFAIKVSTIVADTAVSIMKAFADLGPIGGAVAAALLAATGAAQVVMANAERDKIKNLQPKTATSTGGSISSSASNAANMQRVLTGYSDGGYTGDGDRYEVAGLVHKGEYVVPKPIMENPRVVDAVGTIEAIRLNRMGKTAGFADGGYTSGGASGNSPATGSEYPALISELRSLTREMQTSLKNVRAYLVFQDLERAQKTIDNSRAPFTK